MRWIEWPKLGVCSSKTTFWSIKRDVHLHGFLPIEGPPIGHRYLASACPSRESCTRKGTAFSSPSHANSSQQLACACYELPSTCCWSGLKQLPDQLLLCAAINTLQNLIKPVALSGWLWLWFIDINIEDPKALINLDWICFGFGLVFTIQMILLSLSFIFLYFIFLLG